MLSTVPSSTRAVVTLVEVEREVVDEGTLVVVVVVVMVVVVVE